MQSSAKRPTRKDTGRTASVRSAPVRPVSKPRDAHPEGRAKPLPRPATLQAFARQLVDLADDIEERTSDRDAAALACAVRAAATLARAARAAGTGLLVPVVAAAGDQGGTAGLRWLPPPAASATASAHGRQAAAGPETALAASSGPMLPPGHHELVCAALCLLECMGNAAESLAAAGRQMRWAQREPERATVGVLAKYLAPNLDDAASALEGVEEQARTISALLTGTAADRSAAVHASALATLRALTLPAGEAREERDCAVENALAGLASTV